MQWPPLVPVPALHAHHRPTRLCVGSVDCTLAGGCHQLRGHLRGKAVSQVSEDDVVLHVCTLRIGSSN